MHRQREESSSVKRVKPEGAPGSAPDDSAVREVLDQYIKSSYEGDVPALKFVFHPAALMAGYLEDTLEIGSTEPFYADFTNAPAPKATGEAYSASISFIQIAGRIASAGITERNLLGYNYINHLQLVKIEGKWLIVAKAYETVD